MKTNTIDLKTKILVTGGFSFLGGLLLKNS